MELQAKSFPRRCSEFRVEGHSCCLGYRNTVVWRFMIVYLFVDGLGVHTT